METIKAVLAFPFTHPLNLAAITGWLLIGAAGSETIRRTANKISGGKLFGKNQAPASKPSAQ